MFGIKTFMVSILSNRLFENNFQTFSANFSPVTSQNLFQKKPPNRRPGWRCYNVV